MANILQRTMGRLFNRGAGEGYIWPSRASTWNWWQFAGRRTTREFGDFAPVHTCWRILSEEVARVPIYVESVTEIGLRVRENNLAVTRVMRDPNQYQTASDLMLYIMRSLLAEGNAYAVALYNQRQEVAQLYPLNPTQVQVFVMEETGEYFYRISDSETLALAGPKDDLAGYWVPARQMLHIRLFTPDHPLIGASPLTAAAMGINAGMNINQHTAAFVGNMSRPSGLIRTPKRLERSAIERIKERFIQATTGENAGAPMVLTEDMTWESMSMSAVDAEIIASYKLSERQVAQVYRVPPFFLGDLEDAKLGSVEHLMRYFIASGLGFYFEHIAQSLTKFFRLKPNQQVRFDYEMALLQSDLETRMRSYKEAIQGGVFAVNEVRRREGLPEVEYGDDVRMQQQMVPLSYGAGMQPDGMEPEEPEEPEEPAEMSEGERIAMKLQIKRQLRERLAAT